MNSAALAIAPEPGEKLPSVVHYDWSNDEYQAWKRANDAVSYSTLKSFSPNPRRFNRGIPGPSGDSLSFGALLDCLLLEPLQFNQRYVISPYDAYRSNESKDWRDKQARAGLTPYKEKDLRAVQNARDVVAMDPQLSSLFAAGQGVVAVTSHLGGQNVCCLIDWVPDVSSEYGDALGDLKSGDGISDPSVFSRQIAQYKYHWQAAMYLDLWNAATGQARTRWLFPVVDNSEPYECGLVELEPEAIDVGRIEYRGALTRYISAVKTQTWESPYDDGPLLAGLPAWYK